MTVPEIALQLWTVRAQTEADYNGTLRAVAQSGYTAVEPWTLHGLTATQLREAADGLGLRIPAMHFGYARLLRELDTVMTEALTLGCAYVVCSGLPANQDAAAWRAAAHALNGVGQRCLASGLQLVYHNEYDFAPLGESSGFEVLVSMCGPGLVQFELDVFCAAASGADPVAWLQRLHGRVPLVHLENGESQLTPPRTTTWPGEGALPMRQIVQAAHGAGAHWLVVEHDQAQPDSIQCAAHSLNYLRQELTGWQE